MFKAQCRHSEEAENALSQLASFFYEQKIEGLQVLGPIPAPFSKKAGQYRWQLLLQHASRKQLQAALSRYFARADKVFSSAVDFRRGSIGFELTKNSLEKMHSFFSKIKRFFIL